MMYSNNKVVNMVLRYIGDDQISYVDDYVENMRNQEYMTFDNYQQVEQAFSDYILQLYDNLDNYDPEVLRYYTGIGYNSVNSFLRGQENYEKCGKEAATSKKEALYEADKISHIINKSPELMYNVKVYRGTDLLAFKNYGVTTISDLKSLTGQYMYEIGFTSTSLLRDKSFFNRELEYHSPCNIEIEYLIPAQNNDGVILSTELLSYSKSQAEYLMNKGALTKVVDVTIDEEENKAYIRAILIPKKNWDISYKDELNKKNNVK